MFRTRDISFFFFFNDTATTEIYTLSYTTLFRSLANVPYTPPVGPGFYQRTPPAFAPPIAPWLGQMVPFTMTSATQFFPDEGPDALNSEVWIDDYNHVKTLGALNTSVHTPQQTEIGLF